MSVGLVFSVLEKNGSGSFIYHNCIKSHFTSSLFYLRVVDLKTPNKRRNEVKEKLGKYDKVERRKRINKGVETMFKKNENEKSQNFRSCYGKVK